MKEEKKELIRQKIQSALGQIINESGGGDFLQIILDSDLTQSDMKWAKENLDWKVYILGEGLKDEK